MNKKNSEIWLPIFKIVPFLAFEQASNFTFYTPKYYLLRGVLHDFYHSNPGQNASPSPKVPIWFWYHYELASWRGGKLAQ